MKNKKISLKKITVKSFHTAIHKTTLKGGGISVVLTCAGTLYTEAQGCCSDF